MMNQQQVLNFAMQLLQNNPQLAQNPNSQAMIQALQTGDAQAGQMIARNLCQTYGVSPEQAVQQAKRFFNIHQ